MAVLPPSSVSVSPYLGLALIVANDYHNTKGFHPLPGTHGDAQSLRLALQSLHFQCSVRFNISAADFARELDGFVSSRVPACCKYVVFAFCGHGDEQALFGQDGKGLEVSEFTKKFEADQMPHLAGKVRLLFIDACKGDQKDYGVVVPVARGGEVIPHFVVPRGANMLIVYSTRPGYVSQEIKEGKISKSIWMPILAEEITNRKEGIDDVLRAVNRRMVDYSNELRERNSKIFPQSHFVTSTLLTPVNLVMEAEMFQQWLSASE